MLVVPTLARLHLLLRNPCVCSFIYFTLYLFSVLSFACILSFMSTYTSHYTFSLFSVLCICFKYTLSDIRDILCISVSFCIPILRGTISFRISIVFVLGHPFIFLSFVLGYPFIFLTFIIGHPLTVLSFILWYSLSMSFFHCILIILSLSFYTLIPLHISFARVV